MILFDRYMCFFVILVASNQPCKAPPPAWRAFYFKDEVVNIVFYSIIFYLFFIISLLLWQDPRAFIDISFLWAAGVLAKKLFIYIHI